MKKLLLFQIFYLSFLAVLGQTSEPMLTLNSPMHTTKIGRISTDAEGRFMLTCSKDKTARLWEASTGDLLKIFHLPIEEGREGMLYACALSPDGEIAAVAGWTNDISTGDNCINLFNVSSGDIVKRITGLPDVIRDLEFSFDGNYLAAAWPPLRRRRIR